MSIRPRVRVAVAAIVAVLCSLILPLGAPAPADAAACRTYTVIGVRGTDDGSSSSMGVVLPKAANRFAAVKGSANVTTDYVSYPAKGVSWTDTYLSSMSKGRAELRAKLSAWSRRCPSTRFALFGYSQGAHIVGDVVVGMSSAARAKVYGVGLLGDPMMNPTSASSITADRSHGGMFDSRSPWPRGLYVVNVCNRGDQVCAAKNRLQSSGYLTGWFGAPKEHANYTTPEFSPIAGQSGAWAVGNRVASH